MTVKKRDEHPISTAITRMVCYLTFGLIFIGAISVLKENFSMEATYLLLISVSGIFISLPYFNTFCQNKFKRTFSTNIKGVFLSMLLILFFLVIVVLPDNSSSNNQSSTDTTIIDNTSTPLIKNTPTSTMESGPFSTGNYERQQKNEWEAMETCNRACNDEGGEYQSHQGTDAGNYYLLIICNCWRD